MGKRKYTKRSSYWKQFEEPEEKSYANLISNVNDLDLDYEPALLGDEPFYIHSSTAYSRSSTSASSTESRRNAAANALKPNAYDNIVQGMLPYSYRNNGVDCRDAIELCQKAYVNISVFRNSIDMMSEFANSNLYLEGGSKKSRKYIEAWFKKIKLWRLKDQFFREIYRSSNVFFYELDGSFTVEDLAQLTAYGITPKENKVPVRYILLNPYDIVADSSTAFETGTYKKVLSRFEIERLKNPITEEDKQVFKSLNKEAQEKIKTNSYYTSGIHINLDPKRLHYCFLKKQDYEPFATPYGFPVLEDINFKLEMKKIDQSICRTIENVVLLITMGNEPSKGGVNPKKITAMQNLFKNQSIGRVLVSDYTTKMDFIIPDLKKVLGPEKYEMINKDIKEGLQNIIISEEKFANTEIKAKIFLQRLNEARDIFINDFLQPQIKKVCDNFGLRDYPQAKFETIDLKDSIQMNRVITRMLELGVITPDQGVKTIETGIWPTKDEMRQSQREYLEDRKEGLYNPLVGGVPVIEQSENETKNNNTPPQKTPNSPGRPIGAKTNASEKYSVAAIKKAFDVSDDFYDFLISEAKETFGKKRLTKTDKELIQKICENVMVAKEYNEWKDCGSLCLKDFNKILELNTKQEINEISVNHELDEFTSSILYHSVQIHKNQETV